MSSKQHTYKKIVEIMRNENRERIFRRLAKGDSSFSDLQKEFKMTSGNLTYHLRSLELAGVLKKSEKGQYELTTDGMTVTRTVRKLES